MQAMIGTCDNCAHWTDTKQMNGKTRGWGRCVSGKHVSTGWTTHGDESSLIHHADGCECSRSVVQTGPKYGCIHFRPTQSMSLGELASRSASGSCWRFAWQRTDNAEHDTLR